jgi:hypothetical protein
MPLPIAVIATDSSTRARLAAMVPADAFDVTACTPDTIPADHQKLYIIALPGIDTPEEKVIEHLRANDETAGLPIVIASALPMIELQSVPYASDWTIAIVEEPVDQQILADTIAFLLGAD